MDGLAVVAERIPLSLSLVLARLAFHRVAMVLQYTGENFQNTSLKQKKM